MSRILKGLYHFTVYAVGILVLLAAMIVTLVRLALPDIGIYRSDVEAWVSQYMGYPVVFHSSLDMNWQGWVPEFTLKNIDILNKAGTQKITHFDEVRIKFAPLATIIERQFIPKSLIISGFELSVIRHENGSISIQDINLEDINNGQSDDNELAEWLFKQDEIEIRSAQIEWIDLKYQQIEPIILTNVSFKMRNDIGRFQIDGSASLPSNYGNTMDFAFDAFGDLLTSNWSGELYLSANDINPDNWYQNIRPLEFNITGGNADIEVWMDWKQAKLVKLQGQLQYDDFEALIKDERALRLKNLTTRILGMKMDNDGWQFYIKLENFVTENGAWPDTDISIIVEPIVASGKYRYNTSFSYLKIDDLTPFLSNISFLPDNARNFLNKITIDGELSDGTLTYDPSKENEDQFTFTTKFDHLTTNLGKNFPSFSGLSGHVQGTLTHGQLVLQDSMANFTMPSSEGEVIEITELTGNVRWQKTDDFWNLQSDEIYINTPDLTAYIVGSISKNANSSHFLDIVVDLEETDLSKLSDYLPITPGFKLKSWMKRALLGGTVNSASALFRGYLKDFPFDNNNGRFQIIADISDATLEYSRVWPIADQLYGEVIINGRELQANIQNGKIYNAEITTAIATITDILEKKKKKVNITGHIRGEINDLTLFIDQSPLQKHKTLGEIKNALQSGNFGLGISLGIPIRQKDKKFDFEGTIQFLDTVIDNPDMKMHIDNINGIISFTRDSISSDVLTAEYQANPVTITLSGDKEHPLIISISGEGDEKFIVDRLAQYVPDVSRIQDYLLQKMSGTTPWQLQLAYIQDEQENIQKHLEITSSLKGMEIDLPDPFGKRKYSSTPIKISTVLSKEDSQNVSLFFNSIISCYLQLDKRSERKLQSARLYVGQNQRPTESNRKFLISGQIDNLSLQEWIELFSEISNNRESTHPVLNDIEIDLEIAYLELFNQEYSDVKALGSKTEWGWSFNLDDDEIKGDVYFHKISGEKKQVTLLLDKLYIKNNGKKHHDKSSIDPRNIPVLAVEVNEFNHLNRDMGQLILQSSNIYNGVSIDNFEIRKDTLLITGNGTWLSDGEIEQSKFKIDLHADNMNSMLETFNYNPASIKDGETDFKIIADWPGSPMDFSLKNLNGRFELEIKKGQLLDIKPSAGRLFGLLSFQTLPRRLLLDFKDLFGKGLSFDKIEGNFDIANGNAYTNNLYINSPAADVAITGRTGLADQDYDQIVTVTPQVTETIPVAGAIFGPVGIGVGAVIYLVGEMFNSLNNNIDSLLRHQYTITGSWDNPVIEKIKKNKIVAGG